MAKTVKITPADSKIEFYEYATNQNTPADETKVAKVSAADGFVKVESKNQTESRRFVVAGVDRDLLSVIDDDASGLIAAYNEYENGDTVVAVYEDRMEFLYGGSLVATIDANGISLEDGYEFSGDLQSIYIKDKALPNGVASLDANGKVPVAQLPMTGGVVYKGVWDASTGNAPSPSPEQGWYYIVSVAGIYNTIDWQIGDWAVYSGTAWDKIDNTDVVSSVNGKSGAVLLTTDDIEEGNDNLYYTEERVSANEDVAANTADRHTPFYLHVQEVASNTWTIMHNLNRYASVAIIDSSNRQVIGDIEYLNTNQIIVSFNGSFAGKAYLT